MNKYYESIIDAKEYLWKYFDNYNCYYDAIDICDFVGEMRERHYKMKTIKDRMAFIATIALSTFIIDARSGMLMSCNLPATRDVIDFLKTDFKKYYRKKNLCLNLVEYYDYEDVEYTIRILDSERNRKG